MRRDKNLFFVCHSTKKTGKIISIVAPLQNGEEISSQLIKEKQKTDDWKIYEHPKRGIDYIQMLLSLVKSLGSALPMINRTRIRRHG